MMLAPDVFFLMEPVLVLPRETVCPLVSDVFGFVVLLFGMVLVVDMVDLTVVVLILK